MNRWTYAGLVGLHRVPGDSRTATRTRYARLSSHAPPASDRTTKRRRPLPHPPQPGQQARTTRDVRPLAKRPQRRVPTAPRGPELCLSYRQTGSSSAHLSPLPPCLYELRQLARALASCIEPSILRSSSYQKSSTLPSSNRTSTAKSLPSG